MRTENRAHTISLRDWIQTRNTYRHCGAIRELVSLKTEIDVQERGLDPQSRSLAKWPAMRWRVWLNHHVMAM